MAEGSIARTLRVLEALCLHGPQSLSEIARRVGLGAPTTLRFLRLMQEAGYAKQTEDRRWAPTLLVWRLGAAVIDADGWSSQMNAVLRAACDELSETVVYATYDGGSTVYLGSAEPRRELRTHVMLGSSQPAPDTITGRCALAFQPDHEIESVMIEHWGGRWRGRERACFLEELEAVRRERAAVGVGDVWSGLWGAAVPVSDGSERVTGAIGTAIPSGRQPVDAEPVIAVLRTSASQLEGRPERR